MLTPAAFASAQPENFCAGLAVGVVEVVSGELLALSLIGAGGTLTPRRFGEFTRSGERGAGAGAAVIDGGLEVA
jgi:hypothetical protein